MKKDIIICDGCGKELENVCGSVEFDLGFGCDSCVPEHKDFCSKSCLLKFVGVLK